MSVFFDWKDNHAQIGWNNTLVQHKGKFLTEQIYKSLLNPLNDIEAACGQVQRGTLLDTAIGDAMDGNASIVGVNRSIPFGISMRYFGFIDQPGAGTFGEAPIRDHRSEYATRYDLPDDVFIRIIRAKIILNNAHGTLDEITQAAEILFGTPRVKARTSAPGEVTISLDELPDVNDPLSQIVLSFLPNAAGIRVVIEGIPQETLTSEDGVNTLVDESDVEIVKELG